MAELVYLPRYLSTSYCDNFPPDTHTDDFITAFKCLDNRRSPEDHSVIDKMVPYYPKCSNLFHLSAVS